MANELRTRILGGAIFGAVVLACTLLSFWSFAAMCVAGFVILMKEWRGLTKHRSGWWLLAGIFYIGIAILSLLLMRAYSEIPILILLGFVWASDIAAYAIGKPFGKHKIAPSISPGKSWEGLAASLFACGAIGFAFTYIGEHLQLNWQASSEGQQTALFLKALKTSVFAMPIAILGLAGDMFESYLKRHAGVKDSGNIIPGHGGLFDRVDALLACTVVVGLVFIVGMATQGFH